MTFNISPSVKITEFDSSVTTENVDSTLIGGVIHSTRGEAYKIQRISNEREMVTFANKPTDANYDTWFPAFKFLDYANSLLLVRAVIRKDSIKDGLTEGRIPGTKATVNAQLGVFQDDNRKYPNVFFTADFRSGLTLDRVVGETFRSFDHLYLTKTYAGYTTAGARGTLAAEDPLTTLRYFVDFRDTANTANLLDTDKTYRLSYNSTPLFRIKIDKERDKFGMIQDGTQTPKTRVFTDLYGNIGSLAAGDDANFIKISEFNGITLVLKGVMTVNADIPGGDYTVNDIYQIAETGTLSAGIAKGDLMRLYNYDSAGPTWTPLDTWGVVVEKGSSATGGTTGATKIIIVENDGIPAVDVPVWAAADDPTPTAVNEHWVDDAGLFTPVVGGSLYWTEWFDDYTNGVYGNQETDIAFNFSPALTGMITNIEDAGTNKLEAKIFSPNTEVLTTLGAVDGRVLNRFDWYVNPDPEVTISTLPEDATDFNHLLLASRDLMFNFVINNTVSFDPWDFESDLNIVDPGEYVPLYPHFNNEFPYVEEEIVDDLTNTVKLQEDPLRNQELQIFNSEHFEEVKDGILFESPNEALRIISRWPGSEGNNVYVATCGYDTFETASIFEGVAFRDLFEFPPRSWDELCFVVLFEEDGLINVQEKFYVSLIPSKKDEIGVPMWIENVINEQSAYVYVTANSTLLDIKEWYIDPLTKLIDRTINPNIGKMPFELNTRTNFFNRYDNAYRRLPKESEVPQYIQRVDANGNPITDTNGDPLPPDLLEYICDSTGKAVIKKFNNTWTIGGTVDITQAVDDDLFNVIPDTEGTTTFIVTSSTILRNGDLQLTGEPSTAQTWWNDGVTGVLFKPFYIIPNGVALLDLTVTNTLAYAGGVGATFVYEYSNAISYDPLLDEITTIDGLLLTGPYHSHEYFKGWVRELHEFYPEPEEFFQNIGQLVEGHDGVNRDGVVGRPSNADIVFGYDEFADPDEVDISIIITGGFSNQVVTTHVTTLCEKRKDCIGMTNVTRTTILGKTKERATDDSVRYRNDVITGLGNISSTYMFMIAQYGYVFDKFNDKFRWIDMTGDTAGLAAASDIQFAVWWTFAGFRRGKYRNIIRLSYNPNEPLRDELVKAQINPIFSSPGDGIVLFHEKMMTRANTLFGECHIRRLFIFIEKAIGRQAKYFLFEFNDQFTRSQFLLIVNPLLNSIKANRGIEDFLVICDESNNPPEVRDRREMFCDTYVKPTGAIYHIGLNIIATRSAVSFQEVLITG